MSDDRDEWRRRALHAERLCAMAEEAVQLAEQLNAYDWQHWLGDSAVSDDARHDSRELGIAAWLYRQAASAGEGSDE